MKAPISSSDNNCNASPKVKGSPEEGGHRRVSPSSGDPGAAALPAEGSWFPLRNALFAEVFPRLRGASLKLLLQLVACGYEYVPAGSAAGGGPGRERYERGLSRAWHLARDVRGATGLSRSGLLSAGEELEAAGLAERTRSAGGRGFAYRLAPGRMAPPDPGRGWTKLPEALVPRLMQASRTALLVTLAVLRKTVGWDKPSDVLATSQLAGATGLAPRSVRRGVRRTLRAGLIQRHESGSSHRYRLAPAALLPEEPEKSSHAKAGRSKPGIEGEPEDRPKEGRAADRPRMSPPGGADRSQMSPPQDADRPRMSPTKDPQEKIKSNRPARAEGCARGSVARPDGRSVANRNQFVQKRSSGQPSPEAEEDRLSANGAKATRALVSAGIDARTARQLARRSPFGRVLEVVIHAQRRDDLRNVPGWIRAALEGGYDLHGDGRDGAPSGKASSGKGESPSHGQMCRRHEVERFLSRGHASWCFQPSTFDDGGDRLYRYRDPRQYFATGTLVKTRRGNLGTVVGHAGSDGGGRIRVRSQEGGQKHAFEPQALTRFRN